MTNEDLAKLQITYNPFEAAGSGAPISSELWMPTRWRTRLDQFFDQTQNINGPKAYAVLGEYGSGKSYTLRWLERHKLPSLRIRPFYFDNPGLQFYDLANGLLRQLGREQFAKTLWEYVSPKLTTTQTNLFTENPFRSWLESVRRNRQEPEAIRAIAAGIREKGITEDEEIAHRFGMLVVQTLDKPYYDYRDFVAGKSNSLVAENEEAPYFAAIVRALRLTGNASAVALLIDEFEDVSLQKRLTSRQTGDYLAMLKRLYNLTAHEELWIVIAMTPQAAEVTERLQPALWERFNNSQQAKFNVDPLTDEDVRDLLAHRLKEARPESYTGDPLYPFPTNIASLIRNDVKSNPRRLIKLFSYAVAGAVNPADLSLPFKQNYIDAVQQDLFPSGLESAGNQ